jgi:hypothetical protein
VVTVYWPEGVSKLDGRSPLSSAALLPKALVFLGYAAAVAVLLIFAVRFQRMFNQAFYAVGVISAAIVVAVCGQFALSSGDEAAIARKNSEPLDRLYEFGQERNVVVILLDMLQGSFLELAWQRDPETRKVLADFTVFTRAGSTFPFTSYSLASILHGKAYASEDRRFGPNLSAAISDSFVTDATKLGYLATAVQVYHLFPLAQRNVQALRVPSQGGDPALSVRQYLLWTYSFELAYASLLRLIKVDARALLGYGSELAAIKESGRNLLERWAGSARVGAARNRLIFMHNLIAHSPVLYTRDGARLSELDESPYAPRKVVDEIGYSFDLLGKVFSKMKQLKIYDDALIIIVGDHGHFMASYLPENYNGVEDFKGFVAGKNFRPAGMYNPAVAIKAPGMNTTGISHAALGLVHIRSLVREYLNSGELKLNAFIERLLVERSTIPVQTCLVEANAYYSPQCHLLLDLEGNISALPKALEDLSSEWGEEAAVKH